MPTTKNVKQPPPPPPPSSLEKIEIITHKRTDSLSYHSLIRHNLLDVSIEESDDNGLAVSTDFFSCTICKGNETRAVAVYFFHLKADQ